MRLHRNAKTTPVSRALLVSRVRQQGWTVEAAATCILYRLVVHPRYRRLGIARALVRDIEGFLSRGESDASRFSSKTIGRGQLSSGGLSVTRVTSTPLAIWESSRPRHPEGMPGTTDAQKICRD